MRIRLAGDSDREAWDRHVTSAPNGGYQQLYGWGEIRSLDGWEPLRVLIEEDGILGVIQMASRRLPGLGLRLFYAPRGPVMAEHSDLQACRALLDGAAAEAARRGGVLLRVDPEPASWGVPVEHWLSDCRFHQLARRWSYWNWATYSFRIDLRRSPEDLFASFGKTRRQGVRRAERLGVEVAVTESRDDVRILHGLVRAAAERNGFTSHSLEYFQACWDQLVARGQGYVIISRQNGVPAAVSLNIASGRRAWSVYGAPDPAMRSAHAYEAHCWRELTLLRERGLEYLDLGPGSGATPNEPGDRVCEFKRAFRPEVVLYPGFFDRPLRPLAYRAWRSAEEGLPRAQRTLGRCRRRLAGILPSLREEEEQGPPARLAQEPSATGPARPV